MSQVAVVIGGGQTLGEFLCRGLAAEGLPRGGSGHSE
ncbi:Sorbitol-6-phosphate 2-dehydrogenase [Enterobacter asburiae]|uniref:Sorbitol-6-phosphate 2-dehydrogenase n=1 Tax=Enterobacter asburiae TaxID=61645 RepID=A0A376FAY9_ENTAS|nr:Sorbitol-6-phosphate 2-dehydrogenase [Enterobacter asburiae]